MTTATARAGRVARALDAFSGIGSSVLSETRMFSAMTSDAWIVWACLMFFWTVIQVLLNLVQTDE